MKKDIGLRPLINKGQGEEECPIFKDDREDERENVKRINTYDRGEEQITMHMKLS